MIPLAHEQGSADWLAWRHGGLGGSDAAAVLGVSPYMSRLGLLKQKVRRSSNPSNFAMRRGQRLEDVARGRYAEALGVRVAPVTGCHPDIPYLLASLDGLAEDGRGEIWAIEIKAPKWQDHDAALAGIVPAKFRPQCQHNLCVSGLSRLDYVSFNDGRRFGPGDQLAVVPVVADPDFLALYLPAAGTFWGLVTELRRRRIERAGPGRAPLAVEPPPEPDDPDVEWPAF